MATRNEVAATITANVYENSAQAITGAKMQETLLAMNTASVTPSGSPMHYAYEACGAVYNESTGYWELNGLTDITNAEMQTIYLEGLLTPSPNYISYWWVGTRQRTNICRTSGALAVKCEYCFLSNYAIISATLGSVLPLQLNSTFRWCDRLQRVYGVINCSRLESANDAFYQCIALTQLRMNGLAVNIDLHYSPIVVEDVTYILNNASTTATFTITLKASMQTTYEANANFIAARDAKPNITINYL